MKSPFFVFLTAAVISRQTSSIPQALAFTLPFTTGGANQRLSFRPIHHEHDRYTSYRTSLYRPLFSTTNPSDEELESVMEKTKLSQEEIQKVGNLVADDEWMGLGMELSEIIRCAVLEEVKKNTADFIGKDDYKIGDITKEIDNRVKVRL
jgi:hypothetical protein